MLLNNVKVLRPLDTKIQAKGKYRYVYKVVAQKYIPEKKYTLDTRKVIGRMIDDEYMIPNEDFSTYYPDVTLEMETISEVSDTLKVGNYSVLNKIYEESEIRALLDSFFPTYSSLIQDLVYYMVVKEDSAIQHFPDFFYDHPSFGKKIYSDSAISMILKEEEFSHENTEHFLKAWANLNNDQGKVYLSYDSTNMTTEADIELARRGHSKSGENKPQVNISYAVRQRDALPLLYEIYDGSIIDNSECVYAIDRMKEYGLTNIGFIMDRGYFSKKNMNHILNHGYHFILAIKESTGLVKEFIQEAGLKLQMKNEYYLAEHQVYGTTKKINLYDKEVYLHLYHDNIRAQQERNAYLSEIAEAEKALEKKIEKKTQRKENLTAYGKKFSFKFDTNGYFVSYKRKEAAIEKVTRGLGFFALITSEQMEASEALRIYRDRDVVEKMFRSLKSYLDYDSFRVHSEESLKAKTFIVFIASIVRSKIQDKTKELYKGDRKNYTVPACIRELEKVEVTKGSNQQYKRTSAINAKNKKILKRFEIDEKYIDSTSRAATKGL